MTLKKPTGAAMAAPVFFGKEKRHER